ncbi:HAD-IIIA family hydrolase, partial [Arcobacteraceae bacterium]|nr:HAD-IIIA family hydrolase [Arcobacteraceae bacterium]
ALGYLQNLGYKLVIITNQSGIGRGYYTKEQYDVLTQWLKQEFLNNHVFISEIYCCPHAPDAECDCRKPKIGMIKQASKILNIDYSKSWIIGDKDSDIQTGLNAGITNTIQVKSGHHFDEKESKALFVINSIKDVLNIIKS